MAVKHLKSGNISFRHLPVVLILILTFAFSDAFAAVNDFQSGKQKPAHFQGVSKVPHNQSGKNLPVQRYVNVIPPTITLTGIPFESRIAQLSWTTSDPLAVGDFYIERDVASSGSWVVLKQLPYTAVLKYDDTISSPYCSATNFSYRIRFEVTATSETGYSNVANLVLWDLTNPANPGNIIVSIVPTSTVSYPVLFWNQVSGDDIFGYEIQRYNGLSWPTVTTLPSDSSSYLDRTVSDGCMQSYAYAIVTIDQCSNRSPATYVPAKQTIKLDLPPIDDCERLANLSWNSYNLMPGGLGGYRIYRKTDSGSPVLVKDITDTLSTSYSDPFPFENGRLYTYYVQAYSATGPGNSASCEEGSVFTGASMPDSIYITSVSVENNNFIRINYHSTPANTIKKLVLERSDGGVVFKPIDSLLVTLGFVAQDSFFSDNTAKPRSQSYYYRLKAYDDCGTETISINISRSVYLQCSSDPTQNTLNWNSYELWLNGVEGYKVFRTVDGQPATGELLGSLTPLTLSFPDLLSGVDPTKPVCYWVTAAENPGNPYLNNAISLSNTCCINKGATLFMPNAFHPGGLNNRLRPIATFVDPFKFNMIIFNRWGQQIFETSDMVNGWDGTVNGLNAPMGLYVYVITYTSLGGQDYTQRGSVSLIR